MATAFSYRSKKDSSDSNSDDSDGGCGDWKRATKQDTSKMDDIEKIHIPTPLPPVITESIQRRKRNNIWSDVMQDQMMSETLTQVGLKRKPVGYGDRGEESYDYTLAHKFPKTSDSDEEKSGSSNSSPDSPPDGRRSRNSNSRNPHYVKLVGANLETARKIVKTLNEKKPYLIFRAVKLLGIEKALEILKKTEDIEEAGGMMIHNNSRRRTPGGVYLQLLRTDTSIEKKLVDKVFEGEMNSYEMKRMYDERKKKKKQLKAAKKALLKELNNKSLNDLSPEPSNISMEPSYIPTEPSYTPKEPSYIPAEPMDAEMEVIYKPPAAPVTVSSDLEDGEIED